MNKENTCCFTGHRPKSLPWVYDENSQSCQHFKEDLKVILHGAVEYGLTTFLTGMAEGFDMIAAEIVLELKNFNKDIRLVAVVPCLGQESLWRMEQQTRYRKILNLCDEKIVLVGKYTKDCMNKRNLYMVEHSSVVIACFNGKPSGTGNTIRFAKERGLKVRIINPEDYK